MNAINYLREHPFTGLIVGTSITQLLPNPAKGIASKCISIIFNTQLIREGCKNLAEGNRVGGLLRLGSGASSMMSYAIHAKEAIDAPSINCIKEIAKNAFYNQNNCLLPLMKNLEEPVHFAKMVNTNQCAFDGTENQAMEICSNNIWDQAGNETSYSWLAPESKEDWLMEFKNKQTQVATLIDSECTVFGKAKKAIFG